jgi:hypothetical protein
MVYSHLQTQAIDTDPGTSLLQQTSAGSPGIQGEGAYLPDEERFNIR